jgi:hypothetical protein
MSRVHYVLDSGVIDCADSSSDAMPISMSGPDSAAAPRNCKAIRHRKKTGRSACCILPRAVFQRVLSSPLRQRLLHPSELECGGRSPVRTRETRGREKCMTLRNTRRRLCLFTLRSPSMSECDAAFTVLSISDSIAHTDRPSALSSLCACLRASVSCKSF